VTNTWRAAVIDIKPDTENITQVKAVSNISLMTGFVKENY
jgi:hypothetical protein